MSGSVGTVKIPIVSTFDASGLRTAKQGLKDLEAGPAGVTARAPKLPGMPAAFKDAAGQMGLGRIGDTFSKFTNPQTGAATAAVGLFVSLQKSAMAARDLGQESQKLGITVGMYRDMAWNAPLPAPRLEQMSAGIEKVNNAQAQALGGDIAQQAFFAGLGVSPEQLAKMQGDPAALARIVARSGNTAQQIQMFGSVGAANAMAKSSADNGQARARNDALQSANLHLLEHPLDTAKDAEIGILGSAAAGAQMIGRAIGGGMSLSEAKKQMLDEARAKESKEALDRVTTARAEAGSKFGEGLLSAHEHLKIEKRAEALNSYSDISTLTGVSEDELRHRAETQRVQKQQAFDSQYQNPYERHDAQQQIALRQGIEGSLTFGQTYRAVGANDAQLATAVAGIRSNAENMRRQIGLSAFNWNDPNATRETRRDEARGLGEKLTSYVEGMTAAGPQAAAAGANTVQGASMMMNAEYQMDQSQNVIRMVNLLTQIAVSNGKMSQDLADALKSNLGFRYSDPISLFGQ